MRKGVYLLIIFVLLTLSTLFIAPQEGTSQPQQDEYLELKQFSEHFHHEDGRITFSSRLGDHNTWDGSSYQYYIWNNMEKSVQFATSKLYFFDWYCRLDNLDDMTLIDDMRWQINTWDDKKEEWDFLDLYNRIWYAPIMGEKEITFIQGYDDGSNFLNVSYVVRNQANVKVNLDFLSGGDNELRFVWQLAGIDGNIIPDLSQRDFRFDNIVISCNDTDPSVGFDYEWTAGTKKLDVRLGSYFVMENDHVHIDPTFSEKLAADSRDCYAYLEEPVTYTAITTSTYVNIGMGYVSAKVRHYNATTAFDTGISGTIASTSNAELVFTVEYINSEADEYVSLGLYDKGDSDEYWDESEVSGNPQGLVQQSAYYENASFYAFFGETEHTNITFDDDDMGIFIDEWVTHHNNNPSTRSNISFKWGDGSGMDPGQSDHINFYDVQEGNATAGLFLTFDYTLAGAGNNAPLAVVHIGVTGTLYAGKTFTCVTNHTDSDGAADLAWLLVGLGDDQYDITVNATPGVGAQTTYVKNGSSYVNSVTASGSSITNGYQVTWTFNLTFQWTDFDDSSTIDTWAQSWDDEPESSSWATHDSNSDYENDLECESLNVYIDTRYEYGGSSGIIEDTDWFAGGYEVTVNGTIQYEGSSENFESTYALAVNVELYYDTGATGEKDTSISSGVFDGITYTPTSASGVDTTAYFDVVINDIPTGGSDVTGAGIEITSKRDNEDPTTTFHSITENDPHTYIYATGQTIYFSDEMGVTDQLATLAVNASDSSGSGVYCVTMSAWDDEAEWNDTTSAYERQYSTDSSETSGSITFYAIDNVGNTDSTPVTVTMTEDLIAPSGSVAHDQDSASIGYAPINASYDDDSTLDYTASGASDSGAGLPAACYSWNGSAWTSDTTKQYTLQPDGNITLTLTIRDNVGNNYTVDCWVIIDTDSPTGFTITWDRINGTYPIQVYELNLSIYFDSGNECNNYTTVTVNDDGTIQESAFWCLIWDLNSVFETNTSDTSGLPDNKNFYYKGDTNGSFIIRLVNNAGNYQQFNYTAYDTLDGGCGEPPTSSAAPSGSVGPGNYQMNPWEYFHPYLLPFLTLVPLWGTIGLVCVLLYRGIRRMFR